MNENRKMLCLLLSVVSARELLIPCASIHDIKLHIWFSVLFFDLSFFDTLEFQVPSLFPHSQSCLMCTILVPKLILSLFLLRIRKEPVMSEPQAYLSVALKICGNESLVGESISDYFPYLHPSFNGHSAYFLRKKKIWFLPYRILVFLPSFFNFFYRSFIERNKHDERKRET